MKYAVAAGLLMIAIPALADDFRDQMLKAHNGERALMGEPPLKWDPILAAHAAGWAEYLAGIGHLEHDRGSGEGENLWMGDAGAYKPYAMVDDWIGEKVNFAYGAFPYVSRTHSWHDIGHYTQIIWRHTERLGCAMTTADGWDYLVCRYRAPGNVVGEKPY
jgi:uncharacterized protein YkwD